MNARLLEKLLANKARIAEIERKYSEQRERKKINDRRNRIYDLTNNIKDDLGDD